MMTWFTHTTCAHLLTSKVTLFTSRDPTDILHGYGCKVKNNYRFLKSDEGELYEEVKEKG